MDHRYISFGAKQKMLPGPSRQGPAPAPRKSLDSRGQRAEARALRQVVLATKSATKSLGKASASATRPKKSIKKKPAAKKSAAKKSAAPKNLAQKRTTAPRKTAPRKRKSPRRSSSSNELLCRQSYDWGPGNTHSNVSESRRRRCMRLRNSEGESLNDPTRCRESPKGWCIVRGKRQYSDNSRSQKAARDFRALKRSGGIKNTLARVKGPGAKKSKAKKSKAKK